jgi:2-beta-glucuronyltransferase
MSARDRAIGPPDSPPVAVVFTAHFHSALYRKTDVHLIAEALARAGYSAHVATVGQSRLKQLVRVETKYHARAVLAGAHSTDVGSHVVRELYHPPSGNRIVNSITAPLLWGYGSRLDPYTQSLVERSSLILLECGNAPLYLQALRRRAPAARICGLLNDRLDLVGFRPEVVARNAAALVQLDFVRVPAEPLLASLPKGCNARYIPHGVEKALFDGCSRSPYAPGTRNLISVGNMLFDQPVVRAIAQLRPDVTVHIIGARVPKPRPPNIIVHGEMPFATTIPYIKFATAGIAAYTPSTGMEYLGQSSMKLLQYAYCGLPVLAPRELKSSRPNVFGYARGDGASIAAALAAALQRGRVSEAAADILDWQEVAEALTAACYLGR